MDHSHIDLVIRLFLCVHFYPSKTTPKNLDPSYKMDLDLWDCLTRRKNHVIAELIQLIIYSFIYLEPLWRVNKQEIKNNL